MTEVTHSHLARLTRAFNQGAAAGDGDRPLATNPYQPSNLAFDAWNLGYREEAPLYRIRSTGDPHHG